MAPRRRSLLAALAVAVALLAVFAAGPAAAVRAREAAVVAPGGQEADAAAAAAAAHNASESSGAESSSEAVSSSEASEASGMDMSSGGAEPSSSESESESSSSDSSSSSAADAPKEHTQTEVREETLAVGSGQHTGGAFPKIDLSVADGAAAAAAAGEVGALPSHEGSAPGGDDDVTKTLARLGTVLNKMFVQVENDEHMFKAFKEKVLEDEVSKSNVDLSWPAIKELVRSEVGLGRQKIENQVNNFKVEVLDVVQRGLGDLRASLRATITTGFVAPSEALAHAEAGAAAKGHGVDAKGNAVKASDATIDDNSAPDVGAAAAGNAAPGDSPNADDEGDDTISRADAYAGVASPLDAVSQSLRGHVGTKDVLEIRQMVLEKMAHHAAEDEAAARRAGLDAHNYGQTADEALTDLRQELGQRLSSNDFKREVLSKLSGLRKEKLGAGASPAAAEALRRLEAGLGAKTAAAPALPATHNTGNAVLDRLQHRLDSLVARTQRVQQDRAEVDAAVAKPAAPADSPFVVEAVDVTHGQPLGDGRVEADLKSAVTATQQQPQQAA